ncbi:MAG TPA: homocysteine S-methyltransferase family protein, partial [Gaiellaceae bacterium]|nr:homocysteine S-methyltransferase family protein [Gaiellaceae bacterium]
MTALPTRDDRLCVTDGGMETTLIFRDGLELPEFATFPLLDDDAGLAALRGYYESYVQLAAELGTPIVLDTVTWRASPDWGKRLGYEGARLDDVNRRGVALLRELPGGDAEIVVSGCVGPRGDAYVVGETLDAEGAEDYHERQIAVLAAEGVDLISALTLTHVEEATGIVRAAQRSRIPVVISFTVETDGRLPSGQPLGEAIEQVDRDTDRGPVYFMVNCAHPTHFADVLEPGAPWVERIAGVRANASTKSHEELDNSEELDPGDPDELAD